MRSIPKIYALGTRFNADIFDGPIVIEEKIDGSQFSFTYSDGVLVCRSKGQVITGDPGMFREAVETATKLATESFLVPGWVYQCEFLAKPKHNVLKYDRIPAGHLVLFDIFTGTTFVDAFTKQEIAKQLGLEPVPILADVPQTQFTFPSLRDALLERESVLGGTKIEGIVIKNYGKEHPEAPGQPMTAKVVSDKFKEKMARRPMNPKAGPGEFIQALISSLRTEARWVKAIQHLKEENRLLGDNRDIGPLCKEIQRDILEEESDWIKQQLFDEFSKEIIRGSVQGFAQYYQKLLAEGPTVFQLVHQNL